MLLPLLLLFFASEIPSDHAQGPTGLAGNEFMQKQDWFSGSVLVAFDANVVLHHGYGWTDSKRRVPIRTDTLFGIASISKQFTASALLQLEEHSGFP